jgi:chromosome segregation ATPase
VLANTGAEAGSPPTYDDLDAKLRALSGRDPKLAGMLGGQPHGSAKVMEQAVELERLSGEVATLQRKLANTEQILREAELELKQAAAETKAANAKTGALSRQMEQREHSFRAELAKAQRDFNDQLAASRAEAERVVQEAEQRVKAIQVEAAQKESRLHEEMAEQVEQVRRRADERVAQIEADAESARSATSFIRSPAPSTADAERIVALEAAMKKVKDELTKERKRTRDMVKEHGARKQELLEAQAALSRYEAERQSPQCDSQSAGQAEAAIAKAAMLQRELDGMKAEATRQSILRDDLVSQISGLRNDLKSAKAQVGVKATAAQAISAEVQDERVAKLRDEVASVRAAMASMEEERQTLLRDNEEATAQVEAMRRKLNAAPNAQSLLELTREYEQLKAAGNLAEAFPIGQRIRQLQRQGQRDSDNSVDESMNGIKDSNERSSVQASYFLSVSIQVAAGMLFS